MSTLPTVSVVIVNWNARHYLAECLASLTADVYAGPMEIIVVDNASTDGSVEMVRQNFPQVTLICNDSNLGFSKANNIGIRRCKGRYLALINSDVHVLKNCIGELVDYCESHTSAGMVGPLIFDRYGHHQSSYRGFPDLWNMFCRALALDSLMPSLPLFNGYLLRHSVHETSTTVDILSGCFWLVRRDALDEVGLLDEDFFIYGEDMDWCKRFRHAGWPAVFVPQAHAIHYGGASSANAPIRFSIEMQRADRHYWAKHHSQPAVGAYVAISILNHTLRVIGYSLASLVDRKHASVHWHKVRCSAACLKWMVTPDRQQRGIA